MLGAYPTVSTLISTPLAGINSLVGNVDRLLAWPVSSQLQARRNALVASTACAQRRAEREDVADYLEARAHRAAHQTETVSTTVRLAHG